MRGIAALAIPTLGSVLADPLMSLVDTACVGQVSSVHLAALGPCTAIFNFVFQCFGFLAVAITNILATNSLAAPGITAQERERRRQLCQRMLGYGVVLALIFGCALTAVLSAAGPRLLLLVGAQRELLPPALAYLRIRALAAPAVMVMQVAQGACLGQQDAWTPLQVFGAAGLLNLVLDWWLIICCGMGAAGAAIATSFAQYLGAVAFLLCLRRRGRAPDGIPLTWQGLPRPAALRPFAGIAATLLSRSMAAMTAYTAMTSAATMLGTLSVAAHQVTLQVFWFLSYIPEPLSIAAQSLIARDSTDPPRVRRLAYLLLRLGALAGLLLAGLQTAVLYCAPWLFTADAAVMGAVRGLAPQAALTLIVCGVAMMCDGVSIGSSDYDHLARTNLVALLVVGSCLWLGRTAGWGLGWVWWTMVAFFVARAGQHALHHYVHRRRSAFGRYERGPASAIDTDEQPVAAVG